MKWLPVKEREGPSRYSITNGTHTISKYRTGGGWKYVLFAGREWTSMHDSADEAKRATK